MSTSFQLCPTRFSREGEKFCRRGFTLRVALLRRLAGWVWGDRATTFRTATLPLVNSTTEYCAAAFSCSVHTDLVINDVLQTVTLCPRPTPADNLPILTSIQPAELCYKEATRSPACRAKKPGHLLHSMLTCPSSRNVPAAKQLISSSDDNNKSAAVLADNRWNAEWLESTTRLRIFIPDIGIHPGMALSRTTWVQINRFRTGLGRCYSCLHKCVWPLLQLVTAAHSNRPLTMSSFTVQSIDLLMECMA